MDPKVKAKAETKKEEVVVADPAVELSKAVESDVKEQDPKAVEKANKEILKDDEAVKEAISNGDVAGLSASQMSVLQKPMVETEHSARPVYETAEGAMLALAAQGKLSTPSE